MKDACEKTLCNGWHIHKCGKPLNPADPTGCKIHCDSAIAARAAKAEARWKAKREAEDRYKKQASLRVAATLLREQDLIEAAEACERLLKCL
jgi:hypothetical protein